jgi:hypothetical protein
MYAEDVTRQDTAKKEVYAEVDETSPWEDQMKSLHEHALGKAQSIRQSFDAYYRLALLLEQRQEMNDFLNPKVKARDEYRNLVGKSSKYTLRVMRRTYALFKEVGQEQIPKLKILSPRTLERMTSSIFEQSFLPEVRRLIRLKARSSSPLRRE